jgi:cytochrome P450
MGENFFGRNGPRATHVRKSVAPAFAHANIPNMTKGLDACVERWITTTLDPAVVKGSSLNISHEMQRITADIICKIGFDYQMSEDEFESILPAMDVVFTEFAQEVPKNPLRKTFWWTFAEGRRAQKAAKTLVAFCQNMIISYRGNPDARDSNSIIANLVADEEYVDDAQRARDLMVLLAAGYDTTSLSLAWALLELARHPAEQIKLRSALQACATNDEARNCQALRNVIRETLRLDIVAALGGVRETSKEWTYNDYVLPKGSIVHVPLICLHRDETIYKDADTFVPSRWDNPNDDQLQAFMPFVCGRRNCIGQALANTEMYSILHRLISDYEFEVVKEGKAEFQVTFKSVGTLLKASRI